MNDRPNRREVLRSAGRYAVASLVVLGGAALVSRAKGDCRREYPCEKCREFGGCGLSKAIDARRER